MSDVGIFVLGSLVFIITTWATFAFGLVRVNELQMRDLEASPRIADVTDEGLTEVWRTKSDASG